VTRSEAVAKIGDRSASQPTI